MRDKPRGITVCVVDEPFGVHCTNCEKIVVEIDYSIGIIDGKRHYLILDDTPLQCCGEDVDVPVNFKDEAAAVLAQEVIIAQIQKSGDLFDYQLQEVDEDRQILN